MIQQSSTAPALDVQGLSHYFGEGELKEQILFDVDLAVNPGEFVIITGESGSGKTTLLTLIGGIRGVQTGSLKVLGREMRGLSHRELVQVRRGIGFIFQAHNLFGSLTAFQNVCMAVELKDCPAETKRSLATEALKRLKLGHRLEHRPDNLSGGQRQRVAVARAVVNKPKLILADEPTAALDEESAALVVELLLEIARHEGATILTVTHDKRILGAADRMVEISQGRIVSNMLVNESIEKCEYLTQSPLFRGISPNQLLEFSEKMVTESYAAGDVIIRQGDEGDKFYVIKSGRVDVSIGETAPQAVVATLTKGEYFGETALLTGEPRNATVTATSEVEVYVLSKQDFQQAMAARSSFQDQLRREMFVR